MMGFNVCSTEVIAKYRKCIDLLVPVFSIQFSIFVTITHIFISNYDCLVLHTSRPCCVFDSSQECVAPLCFPVLIGVQQALIQLSPSANCRRQNSYLVHQRHNDYNQTLLFYNIHVFAQAVFNFHFLFYFPILYIIYYIIY